MQTLRFFFNIASSNNSKMRRERENPALIQCQEKSKQIILFIEIGFLYLRL